MAELKNFILRNKDGTESGVFTGHQPRQAALKAALEEQRISQLRSG